MDNEPPKVEAPSTSEGKPVICPECNGTGEDVRWGRWDECLICAGHKVVLPSLRDAVLRARKLNAVDTSAKYRQDPTWDTYG